MVISSEPAAEVQLFLQRNHKVQGIKLPFITGDTALSKLFPHTIVPHEVWLNSGCNVIAVTSQFEVTASNINLYLEGKAINLPYKQDELSFNRNIALFESGNGGSINHLISRSIMAHYLPGVPSVMGSNTIGNTQRFYYVNLPLFLLYQTAYGIPRNRIISTVKDSFNMQTEHENWNAQWLFSYEITLPAGYALRKRKILMQQDLDRYTGCHAQVEERETDCWFLVKASGSHEAPNTTTSAGAKISIGKGSSSAKFITQINSVLADMEMPPVIIDSLHEPGEQRHCHYVT
ncbi:hypothetical protein [Parafilimonas sp.]|uniref:hypothetical protein n=1 Tax=Parafilimonas sp. TaxID=1969739 RepID=UPI0039E5BD4A